MIEKLIRHRIPEVAARKGEVLRTRVATKEEMPGLFREKLQEEVSELLAAKNRDEVLDEAVDLIEVCLSYMRFMGVSKEESTAHGFAKWRTRGTFDDGVVLIEDPDA